METPAHARTRDERLLFVYIDPDPEIVLPNPDNWRIHPQEQKAAVEALIYGPTAPGWAGTGLINDRRADDGWHPDDSRPVWLNGHLRRELGQDHDQKIPALVGHWGPQEEALILATFDRVGEWATIDKTKTEYLLNIATADSEAIMILFAQLAKDAGLYNEWLGSDPNATDSQAANEIGEEQPPQPGPPEGIQIIRFGRHEVVAGPQEVSDLETLLTEYLETRGTLSFFVARELLGEDPQE